MMTWKDKVIAGMELIYQGCKENPDWRLCQSCPFDEYCSALYEWTDREVGTMHELFEEDLKKYLTK